MFPALFRVNIHFNPDPPDEGFLVNPDLEQDLKKI
jgi:hypothetical protein